MISSGTFEQWFSSNTSAERLRTAAASACRIPECGAFLDKLSERLGSFGVSPCGIFECTGGFGASPSSIWEHQAALGQARAELSSVLGAQKRALKAFPEAPAAPGKRIRTIRTLWGHRASRNCDFERPTVFSRPKRSSDLRRPRSL